MGIKRAMSTNKLSHQATILVVRNVDDSIQFYSEKLGFECFFRWENPSTYAVLKRDNIAIHLASGENLSDPNKSASIYIFCHDVKGVYEEFKSKGVEFHEPLNSTDYGMIEFVIIDTDDNKIVFGQGN